MKSTDRIIKDIRFYETKPKDFVGDFNGIIGNVYKITEDTNSIGKRIARKLNEFEFISGEFDHIYINFTEISEIGKIVENEKTLDKRIKNYYYGIKPEKFNSLKELEKDLLVKEIAFKTLKHIYENNNEKIEKIIEVENLVNKFETEIEIAHKIKETNSYKIEICYMIKPKNSLSKIVIKYFDKKKQTQNFTTKDLYFYEDIFYLIDKIDFKNNKITLIPKKTSISEIATAKYRKPIEIELNEMVNYNSH
uniref:hypothetical protein n=1 Tax=Flavobacterium sp. TaxID=239 RepID=UPI0040499B7A